MTNLKLELYALCNAYLDAKIQRTEQSIAAAQQAANQETKSSMGDKYETGRAMMQLEIEKHSAQRAEWLKMRQELQQIDPAKSCEIAQKGALVDCGEAYYFIAIAAGKLQAQGKTFFSISLASPIGELLLGKKAGEHFSFRDKKVLIQAVY